MRALAAVIILGVWWAASGCATVMNGLAVLTGSSSVIPEYASSEFALALENYSGAIASDRAPRAPKARREVETEPAISEAVSADSAISEPAAAESVAAVPQPYELQSRFARRDFQDARQAPEAPEPEDCELAADAADAEPLDADPLDAGQEPLADDAEPAPGDFEAAASETEPAELDPEPVALDEAPDEIDADDESDARASNDDVLPASDQQPISAGLRDIQPAYAIAAADSSEEIPAPAPGNLRGAKPADAEDYFDRFRRPVADVPLDITPPEGTMPLDKAATEFAEGTADPRDFGENAQIVCSYTPWTICYRPLYFEEISLERYGWTHGLVQPAISGAHFFGSVALLPYKMTVRRPRSCMCSNGFSRCGDCPLPGYSECVWRWDAALVEAAVVTGIVFILP